MGSCFSLNEYLECFQWKRKRERERTCERAVLVDYMETARGAHPTLDQGGAPLVIDTGIVL